MLNVEAIRADFPILSTLVRGGKELAYLDSAATSQKPLSVLDAERDYYLNSNAAVHRGAYELAERATTAYELSRANIADFFNATPAQLVFTRNATEAINLVAYAFSNATAYAGRGESADARFVLEPGDEILVTEMEHHSNLVPWQEVAAKTGAVLRHVPLTDDSRLDLSTLPQLLNERTKIFAFVHQSNILGTVNPIEQMVAAAKAVGALTLVDICQSAPHSGFDFADSGADFAVFSGHKMLGPTGLGGLLARSELLAAMPPFLLGGSMIGMVQLDHSSWAEGPQKFEAGTPNAAQAVGLSAAVDYLRKVGMAEIWEHEHKLTALALAGLQGISGVRVIGPQDMHDRGGAVSFVVDGIHPHDVGQVLDSEGVAVRVGHHCAWPVCRRYSVPATTRASFYLYNTESEVERLVAAVHSARKFFGVA